MFVDTAYFIFYKTNKNVLKKDYKLSVFGRFQTLSKLGFVIFCGVIDPVWYL